MSSIPFIPMIKTGVVEITESVSKASGKEFKALIKEMAEALKTHGKDSIEFKALQENKGVTLLAGELSRYHQFISKALQQLKKLLGSNKRYFKKEVKRFEALTEKITQEGGEAYIPKNKELPRTVRREAAFKAMKEGNILKTPEKAQEWVANLKETLL